MGGFAPDVDAQVARGAASVDVEGTQFKVTLPDGPVLRSPELVGAVLDYADALRRDAGRALPCLAGGLVGADNVGTIAHRTGSTDRGGLAQVMRIIHQYVGGASGTSHGADFEISDPNLIYITDAKALARMVVDLLPRAAA